MKKILLLFLLFNSVQVMELNAQYLLDLSSWSSSSGVNINRNAIFVPVQALLLVFGNEASLRYGFNSRRDSEKKFASELMTGLRSGRMSFNLTNNFDLKVKHGWNAKLGFQIIDKRKSLFTCRVGVIHMYKATGGFVEGMLRKNRLALSLQLANLFGHAENKLLPYASIGVLYQYKGIGRKSAENIL